MNAKQSFIAGLVMAALLSDASAMGIRSFVALPLEEGGTVLRLFGERNPDQERTVLTANLAYGVNARQTLFFGVPYRLSYGAGDRLGDISGLYRYTTWQVDNLEGTSRLGLLGGVVVPTDSNRDPGVQAGAVATFFRHRYEWDLDVLWIEGLGDRKDRARYDIAWQYRLIPAEYPDWGIGSEWDLDLELGGRWERGSDTVHQATIGLQSIHKRWVLEGAVVRDLDGPNDTQFILSTRFHF